MLTYESFVSLLFRWIDFFIIIVGAGYVFWRWGKPFLNKAQENQQMIWQEVEHNIAQNIARTQLLDQKLQQDCQLINELEQKIKLWRAVVEKKDAQMHEQAKRISDRIAQENIYKAQRVKEITLGTLAAAQAIKEAEQVLQETFSHKQKSVSFVKVIIQRLQES